MKHVVVGIISRTRETGELEYLLVKSKKDYGEYTGYYYPPGGHMEGDEQPEQGLVREIFEELQLHIRPIAEIAVTPGDVADRMTHWWNCQVEDGDIIIREEEIADAAYFTKDEMMKLPIWPATKRFFNTYIFHSDFFIV